MAKVKVRSVEIDEDLDFINPVERRRASRRESERRRAQVGVSSDARQGERRRHRRRREDRDQRLLGPVWRDADE